MKMKWYELAEQRRKALGLSQAELADEFNVVQATIGNWLNNRREASIEQIAKVLDRLGVREVTLFPDGMISQEATHLNLTAPNLKVSGRIEFRNVSEGMFIPLSDQYIAYFSQNYKAYAVQIEGTLFEPRIVSGEFIVLEPGTKLQSYDEVLIRLKDGKYLIRVLLTGRNGEWRYADPNTMEQDKAFNPDDIAEVEYIAAIVKPQRRASK